MINDESIPAGHMVLIGNMPVGFRPSHQIYFSATSDLIHCIGFMNTFGEVYIEPKEDIESGSDMTAFTISYLAG